MLSIFRNIPVLCFHDIATPDGMPLERFRAHLDTICDMGFQTISAQKLLDVCLRNASLKDKSIVVTFDDCHVSNWIHAVPELQHRGMTGVFFAVTDMIRSGPMRTQHTSPPFESAGASFTRALVEKDFSQFMTRQELIATVADHGMEVYSHTSRHQGCFKTLTPKESSTGPHWSIHAIYDRPAADRPAFPHGSAYAYNGYWPTEDETFHQRTDRERFDFCVQDLTASLAAIRKINGAKRQLLCWPWGQFDPLCTMAAKQAGFQGAFTLDRFRNGPGTDPFHIHRIPVSHRKSPSWLRSRLRMHATAPGAMVFSKFFKKW